MCSSYTDLLSLSLSLSLSHMHTLVEVKTLAADILTKWMAVFRDGQAGMTLFMKLL